MSGPADIRPDDEVLHIMELCPLENFYIRYFVLPFDFPFYSYGHIVVIPGFFSKVPERHASL